MIMPPVIELTFSIPKEYFQYLSVLSYYRSDKDQEHILSVLVSITLYGMSVVPTWITGKSIGFACKLLDLIISPFAGGPAKLHFDLSATHYGWPPDLELIT